MKYFAIFFGLLTLHLFILMHLQFTAWPEMLSYPYLLNNGFQLYKDIALPYQPFLILILANVYKIFGYHLLTLQIFTWSILLISDLLIFLISRRILGNKLVSVLPVLSYVLIQPLTSGNMLWFDLATIPFILLMILSKKFFWIGFFLSMATLTKQQIGILFIALTIFILFTKKLKETLFFLSGFLIPVCFVLAYVFLNGTIMDWFFWSFEVPLLWYPKFPGYTNWPTTTQLLVTIMIYLPGIIFGLKYLSIKKFNIIILTFGALFLSVFPRFDYFRFQPALPTYVILLAYLFQQSRVKITFLSVFLCFVILLGANIKNINLPSRFFSLSEEVQAKEINNLYKDSSIYLLGVPSVEYVLTSKLPPKPWVDNYVWYMEIDGIQEKVIKGLEIENPKVILWKTPIPGNWYDLGTYQPKKIVEYIKDHYQKTGILDKTVEIWILRQAQGK